MCQNLATHTRTAYLHDPCPAAIITAVLLRTRANQQTSLQKGVQLCIMHPPSCSPQVQQPRCNAVHCVDAHYHPHTHGLYHHHNHTSIPIPRRAAIIASLATAASTLVPPPPAHASKLGAGVDKAWEAMGGGPADLVFPDVFADPGVWDVESTLVSVETPLGLEFVPDSRVWVVYILGGGVPGCCTYWVVYILGACNWVHTQNVAPHGNTHAPTPTHPTQHKTPPPLFPHPVYFPTLFFCQVVTRAVQQDLNKPIRYRMRFIRNQDSYIVPDRRYNTASLMSYYMGGSVERYSNTIEWMVEDPNVLQLELPGVCGIQCCVCA